jgi:hypothetical protein
MERIMSDPVGAGVNSFVKVLGVLDHLETSKQRRELMAQQEADRRIQRERQSKLDTRQEELWKREDEQYFGRKNLGHAVSAYSKMLSAGDKFNPSMLSPEELSSVLSIAAKKEILKPDGTIDNEKINSINYLDNLIRNTPALNDAMAQGKQASINVAAVPGLSKALNDVYGESFRQGTPEKIYIDFSNKEKSTIAFSLKGKDGEEKVMTWGGRDDPNAPIQQIPAPLLSMQIGSLKTLSGLVRQLEAEYGATPLSQKVMQAEETRKKNADAFQAYQKSGGDSKKFVELMVASGADRKEIGEYQKIFDLSSPELKSSKANEVNDLITIEKKHGKDSPQAKQMRELMSGGKKVKMYRKNPKTGDDEMSEDGGNTWGARFSPKQRTLSSGHGRKTEVKNSASDFKRANDDYDEYWITEYSKNAQTEDGKKIDIKQLLNSKSKEDDNFILGDIFIKDREDSKSGKTEDGKKFDIKRLFSSEPKDKDKLRFDERGKPLTVKQLYEYGKTQLNSYLENGMKPSQAHTQAIQDISEYGSKKSFLKKSGQEEFHIAVPKGISRWTVNGKTYKIPQEYAEKFIQENPTARMVK